MSDPKETFLTNHSLALDTIRTRSSGLRPQLRELQHHLECAPALPYHWRTCRLAILRAAAELEIALEEDRLTARNLNSEISSALNPSGRT